MKNKILSKKKIVINIIIIAIVTTLAIFYLFKNNIFTDLSSIKDLPLYAYLIIGLIVLGYILCDSYIIYRSFKGINNNMTFKECIGMYLYGNLGSSITPSKSGHYPMKLFYMEKKGNSIDQALAVVTKAQIIYSLVNMICYILMYLICSFRNISITLGNGVIIFLDIIALIGLGISILSISIFLSLVYIPPINKLVVGIACFFAIKTNKITKEEYLNNQKLKMKIAREQINYLIKHLYKEIPTIIANFGFLLFNNCLPYFIFILLSEQIFSINDLLLYFALYQTVLYVTTFFPLPGNAGIAESTFALVFKSVMGKYIGSCLLLWRLFNYYLLLIIDVIYFIVDAFKIKKEKINRVELFTIDEKE